MVKKKEKGHKREQDFNKQYNPNAVSVIEYKATSDCVISQDNKIISILKKKFNLSSFNTSNKSGKNIQFTLGSIPELNVPNNLEFIKKNSKKLLSKYLKKNNSDKPADLLVYKNNETKTWDFFKMDDVIDYIANYCQWRKLKTGRLKGDFIDFSTRGKRQYLTYEYRKNHKSYFLGLNGNRGFDFIKLLKSPTTGIDFHSDPICYAI